MHSLPAPFLRAVSVLALGAALVLSHINFAAANPERGSATNASQIKANVAATGSITSRDGLADNCYFEFVSEDGATDRRSLRRVQECD